VTTEQAAQVKMPVAYIQVFVHKTVPITTLDMAMCGSKVCSGRITIAACIETSYSGRMLLLISVYNL